MSQFKVIGISAATALALSGCNATDTPTQTDDLPENEYAVEVTLSMADASSQAFASQPGEGMPITVETVVATGNAAPEWNRATAFNTTFSADGTLAQKPEWYWANRTETRYLRAWSAGASATVELPKQWSVDTDQSAGTDASQLLYATTIARFGDKETAQLNFAHQTSLVEINVQIEGSASDMHVTSMSIGRDNLAADGEIALGPSGNNLVWTPGQRNATIIPMAIEPTKGFSASYRAMLIPQTSSGGLPFIDFALNNHYHYTWEPCRPVVFTGGRVTRIDITVTSGSNTLTVAVNNGANAWVEGESTNVTSVSGIDYGPVKPGDYYYSDGSWSDGGFIGYDTSGHGSIIWATPKPGPTAVNPVTKKRRQVVGIVYSNDLSRMGQAEKDYLAGMGSEPHGMVMSVFMTAENTQWESGANDETLIGIPSISGAVGDPLYPYANAQINGFYVCQRIRSERADQVASRRYLALNDIAAMNNLDTGVKSTGWFIPSTGQWFDIFRNLTGMNFTDTANFYTVSNEFEAEDGKHFDWQLDRTIPLINEYRENITEILNYSLSMISTGLKDDFPVAGNYLTTTFSSPVHLYYIATNGGKFISCRSVNKTTWFKARPVLAF